MIVAVLLALLAAFAVPPAQAASGTAPAPAAQVARTAPAAKPARVISLSSLRDGAEQIELHGESDEVTLTAIVPRSLPAQSATLVIAYENAIDILPEKSRLVLSINGKPVAELPLSAYRGPGSATVTLPGDWLKPGANALTLTQEAQHRTICNVRGTFDLWTRLDLARSSLTLRADGVVGVPDLSAVPQMMTASEWSGVPLTILRAAGPMRPDHLGWGAIIAQGYGLALGDRAPRVTARSLPSPGPGGAERDAPARALAEEGKAVLVGTRDEIAPFLPAAVAQAITGPFLAVFPSGDRPGGFLAVVSGVSPEEVDVAALRLADVGAPLPAQPAALVDLPPPVARNRLPVLAEGRYTLASLGFRTIQHVGYRYSGGFDVRFPNDYQPVADRMVTLRIDGAFEGDLGRGAVLNVRVNGQVAGALDIDRRSSAILRRAEIRLPMSRFRAGLNHIEFDAALPPAQETECQYALRRPRFTLVESSEIEIPAFARLVTLPDLGLTARLGVPFAKASGEDGGAPFDLVLADAGDAWTGAALTVVARLAQSSGSILRLVPTVGWSPPSGRDAVIVGPIGGLPQLALTGTPLTPDVLAGILDAGTRMSQAAAAGEPMPEADRMRLIDRMRNARAGTPGVEPLRRVAIAESGAGRWERMATRAAPVPESESSTTSTWRALAGRLLDIIGWSDEGARLVGAASPAQAIGADGTLPDMALLQIAAPAHDGTSWLIMTGTDPTVVERSVSWLGRGGLWSEIGGAATLWRNGQSEPLIVPPSATFGIVENPYDVINLFLIAASTLSHRLDLLLGLLVAVVVVLAFTLHLMLKTRRPNE